MHACIECGDECHCNEDYSDTMKNTPAYCESCGCSDKMDVYRLHAGYTDELETDDFNDE